MVMLEEIKKVGLKTEYGINRVVKEIRDKRKGTYRYL